MYGYEHYSWSPWINPQATIDHHKPSVDSGRYTLFVNYEKTFYCNDDIIIVWNDWFYDITRHTSGQDSMHFGPAFDTIWIRGSLRSFSIANIQPLSLARAKRSNALFYLNYDTTVIYLYTFWARFEICKLKCTENRCCDFRMHCQWNCALWAPCWQVRKLVVALLTIGTSTVFIRVTS